MRFLSKIALLLVLTILFSCQEEQVIPPVELEKDKAPDSSKYSFDAGTLKLIDHYVGKFDDWDDKEKTAIAYKLFKAIYLFKNPEKNIELLDNKAKVIEILKFHEVEFDKALKLENELTSDQLSDIFSINIYSYLKFLKNGVVHRNQQCPEKWDDSLKIEFSDFYLYKDQIYDFYFRQDAFFIGLYIDKIIKLIKDDKKLTLYYENLKSYYPVKDKKQLTDQIKENNEKFFKLVGNKITKGNLEAFFKIYGACLWGNELYYTNLILIKATELRANWVISQINEKSLNFEDNQNVSFAFSPKPFPMDRPLDAWNRFFKFKIKDGKRYIHSEGVSREDLEDDLLFEIK